MRKYCLILFIGFVVWQCKPNITKVKTYYFYNAKKLFHRNVVSNDSLCYLNYETGRETIPADSFSIENGYKIYGLIHYYKLIYYRDTFFKKLKSYPDSIEYFGTEWFKKEENLDNFWKNCGGGLDSLKIYAIEPIEGTDSVIFRRVHRYLYGGF